MIRKAAPLALIVLFSLLINTQIVNSQTNIGVVDGYIYNPFGTPIASASVNVSISGCSGSGCSGTATSESTGYYAVANLALTAGDSVSISATSAPQTGSDSATASGTTLTKNIYVCAPPPPPTLTPVSDSHNPSASLAWTNAGTGYYGEAIIRDELNFDSGGYSTETSPVSKTSLSYSTHTWQVRSVGGQSGVKTCSNASSADSFDITNAAPSAPSLVDQSNTHGTTVTLNWTSGTDSEGDIIHDEFYFDDDSSPESSPLQSNTSISIPPTTHSITLTNLTFGNTYYWRVKTCDNTTASNTCNSTTDSFSITNSPPSEPNTTEDKAQEGATSIVVEFTPGEDPEGDDTFDEFQLANDTNFTNIIYNVTIGNSTVSLPDLDTFEIYYWRVRTCELDNPATCSDYETEAFFTYFCEAVTGATTTTSGGGGGTSYVDKVSNLFVTVPSNLIRGEDISLLIDFQRKSYTNSIKFSVETPPGIEIEKKEFTDIAPNEQLKLTLTGTTSESLTPGAYSLKFITQIDGDAAFIGDFNLSIKNITSILEGECGNNICEDFESAELCVQDCHCGDNICQPNFGENQQNCATDCALRFTVPGLGRLGLTTLSPVDAAIIAITAFSLGAILFLLFLASKAGQAYLLRRYIRKSLVVGKIPKQIYKKLRKVGWPKKPVLDEIKKGLKSKTVSWRKKIHNFLKK